jgi:hypothetical protein
MDRKYGYHAEDCPSFHPSSKEEETGCKCGRPDLHYKFVDGKCPVSSPTLTRDWNEEFDEKFGSIKHRGFPQDAIKSFLKQEIDKAYSEGREDEAVDCCGHMKMAVADYRSHLREKVLKLKGKIHETDSEAFGYELLEKIGDCCPGDNTANVYEYALDEILSLLEKEG